MSFPSRLYNVNALSRCGGSSITLVREFCCNFYRWLTENKDNWIRPPQTTEEIERHMHIYEDLGLPGCIGSLDATHIAWERCPASLQSWFTGKEGYKTIAFNVTCGYMNVKKIVLCECVSASFLMDLVCRHNTQIFSVAKSQPGARNDKTIVNFDDFVLDIRDGRSFANVTWKRWDADGNVHDETGAYLICDGGYHRWPCLQCPNNNASGFQEIAFNKLLTSVRKDVSYTHLSTIFSTFASYCLGFSDSAVPTST
jgi:hypothetical protein